MLGERLIRFWAPAAATAAVALALVANPGWVGLAHAQASGSISEDVVQLTVDADGTVHAREKVTVQGAARREITTRVRQDDRRDRVFPVENVNVTGGGDAPTPNVADTGETTTIELPGSGRRTYTIEYDVTGTLTPIAGSAELRWIAVGVWDVPVASASVTVSGPAPVEHLSCSAGPIETTRHCSSAGMGHTGQEALFTQGDMGPGHVFSVTVGFPGESVAAEPVLRSRHSLATAFTVNTFTGAALILLVVVLLGGFALLYWSRGRDARALGHEARVGRRAPLRQAGDGHVAFAPPDGVRPGQVGTLIDEQADAIDVTATLVDLAVRNYLFIEELPHERFELTDWRLVSRNPPGAELLPYERALYDALFTGRDSVLLSELSDGFTAQLANVRQQLYADVVRQGWFARRPDTVRSRWMLAGLVLTLGGVALTVVLAFLSQLALLGLAAIIAGAALAVGSQYMPAKTAKGSAVLAHVTGFRDFLRGADDVAVPDDQRVEIFSRYLPYALVFDAIDRWGRVVSSIRPEHDDDEPDNLYWYGGPAEWDLSNFGASIRMFAMNASGAISSSRVLRSM